MRPPTRRLSMTAAGDHCAIVPTPTHHTGAASAANSQYRLQTEPDMIRHRSIHEPLEEQDRSMRIVEYAMAIAAFVVAGILAFVR
jgi:hypothetical protein